MNAIIFGTAHNNFCKILELCCANCCKDDGNTAGCNVIEDAGVYSQNIHPRATAEGKPKITKGKDVGIPIISLKNLNLVK